MRKLSLIKNAILLLVMVWLSLKVWTMVSEIANSPRNNDHSILTDSLKNRSLTKDLPPKQVTSHPGTRLKESFDEGLITDETITSMIETIMTTLEAKDKEGRSKTRNTSSLEAIDDKDLRNQSSRKSSFRRTIARKSSSPISTSIPSKTTNKQQNSQPYTIKVKSTTDDQFDTMTTTHANMIEKRHVMLLKVHKCGSSSVQNIFLRFGHRRNLTFILAHDDKNKSESGFTNVISYKHTLSDELIVHPPAGRHFDILCCHVIYNEEWFQKYLPDDTIYIGIVREPVKRLQSAFNYFHMFQNVEMYEFARNPLKYDTKFPSMANNRMAFEYGFPKECFPPLINNSTIEKIQKLMSSYIKSIDKKFDLIIINERMDESLVYMKRLLGWQLKDILFARLLTAKASKREFKEQDALKLKDYLYLDYALYDFAVRRFEEKMANISGDFQEEVKHFQATNDIVGQFCNRKSNETLTIRPSQWNEEFTVTLLDCRYFSMHEMKFIREIRLQQYGTINN